MRRRVLGLAVLLLALSGCTRASDPATSPPRPEAVAEARQTLGAPTVALADALLAVAAEADRVRHTVPRGAEAAAAAQGLTGQLDALREAAVAADAAARPLAGDDRIGRAADVVLAAAGTGLRAADDGSAQAASLQRLSGWDQTLAGVVAAWDAPGSQSQRREELGVLATDLDTIAQQAAVDQPVPEGCPALRDARARRAGRLAERTRELQASATSGGGSAYDDLRASFAADPYGEDPLAVDAADRECWARSSVLAQAAAGITDQVETLEELLQV